MSSGVFVKSRGGQILTHCFVSFKFGSSTRASQRVVRFHSFKTSNSVASRCKSAFAACHDNEPETVPVLNLTSSINCSPGKTPSKEVVFNGQKYWPGHDAFCVGENNDLSVLAIADGVGVWGHRGIDASVFPWALVEACKNVALSDNQTVKEGPIAVINKAYNRLCGDKRIAGASTITLALIDKHTGRLKVAALGDSGLGVIRGGNFWAFTDNSTQLVTYSCPNQLAIIPDDYEYDGPSWTTADKALTLGVQLEKNDLVIMATDGYTDNVFPSGTLAMVQQAAKRRPITKEEEIPEHLEFAAKTMVESAFSRSRSPTAPTPYEERLRRLGIPFRGGKLDDITVLISLVH
eukprot:m.335704 g.335704  ORF g.335704 m.335704 type:complete len:349 (-) comp17658_c0_seq1:87-1133(-)